MANNVEILTSYEKNGVTYLGSFPVYVQSVTCDTGNESEFQDELAITLDAISEEPNE